MIQKVIKEPLVHFIVIALLLFAVNSYLNPNEAFDKSISISEGRIALLKTNFINQWKREPSTEELNNLIQNQALNDAYVLEARSLKLNKGDKIIERRLRQKMDYMLEDLASAKKPDEVELRKYFEANQEKYQTPAESSFKQIFISKDKSDKEFEQSIDEIQLKIKNGENPVGDPSLLPEELINATSIGIEKIFGAEFVNSLDTLPLNQWQGPIDSPFGKHFVWLSQRQNNSVPAFEDVQDKVLNDWEYQRYKAFKQSYEEQLLNKYHVNTDPINNE